MENGAILALSEITVTGDKSSYPDCEGSGFVRDLRLSPAWRRLHLSRSILGNSSKAPVSGRSFQWLPGLEGPTGGSGE